MKHLKQLLSHVGPALIDQVLVSGANFVIGLTLAKLLGLVAFGQFALIWLFILFVVDIQRALLIVPAFSYGPSEPEESGYWRALIKSNQLSVITLSLLASFLLALTELLFPSWGISQYAIVVGLVSVARLGHEFYRRLFFVRHKAQNALIIDLVSIVVLISGLYYLWYSDYITLVSILGLYAIAYGLAFFLGVILTGPIKKKSNGAMTMADFTTKHWPMGRWMLGQVTAQFLTSHVLTFSAAALMGPAAAGIIRIIQYLYGPLHIIFQATDNIIPIHSAHDLAEKGYQAFRRYMNRATASLGGVTLLYGVLVTVITPFVIPLLLDQALPEMPLYVAGYALAYLLASINLCQMFSLRTLSRTRPIFTGYLITAALTVLSAYPLVEMFEIYGVIIGLVLARVIGIAWFRYALYKEGIKRRAPNCD